MTKQHSHIFGIGLAAGSAVFAPHAAVAALVISTAVTSNVTCSDSVCAPTAEKAVLNVGDLENLLEAGNVEVTTTGSNVQAKDITVSAALTWSNNNSLSLDSYRSITINNAISVSGAGGFSITTNDGGSNGLLLFGSKGNVQFANLSSLLAINGTPFTLVDSIASLSGAIATNPAGAYALANDYDASADGTYHRSPVATSFSGVFEGLGNTISNLTIKFRIKHGDTAFFATVATSGVVEGIRLDHERVSTEKQAYGGAGLVAVNYGTLLDDQVDGTFKGLIMGGLVGGNYGLIDHSLAKVNISTTEGGGLVGDNESGTISNSHGSGKISAGNGGLFIGGLVGVNQGFIQDSDSEVFVSSSTSTTLGGLSGEELGSITTDSYATGSVSGGDESVVGGLTGYAHGTIENSYATGSVTGGASAFVGGLVGSADAVIQESYSTGAVSGGSGAIMGGLIGGYDDNGSKFTSCYWDTTTSGVTQGSGDGNEAGITGLTTQQLQSGLPQGFGKKFWAEQTTINGGFPYLLKDPPSKK